MKNQGGILPVRFSVLEYYFARCWPRSVNYNWRACMSVRKHISKTSRDVRSSSNFRCTRAWLGLPLAALRYGLQRYVRFVDGVLFSHNGAYAYTHLPHTVAAACVSCWPVSGTSRLAYTTATKCAVEAKYAVYDCLVAIPLTAPGGQVTHTTTSYKPPPSA